MGLITFDEKDLEKVYSLDSNDNSWWDHEDVYYDLDRKAFVERKYRDDQYTNAQHPQWEVIKILAQGTNDDDPMHNLDENDTKIILKMLEERGKPTEIKVLKNAYWKGNALIIPDLKLEKKEKE